MANDVVDELVTKAKLYRDLGRIARRKRVLGKSWDAWGGRPDQPARQVPGSAATCSPRKAK